MIRAAFSCLETCPMPTANKTPAPAGRGRGRPKKSVKPDEKSVKLELATGVTPEKSRQTGDMSDETYRHADGQDVDLVRETLRAICRDTTAPAAARAQAARTLAEMVGALGRHAAPPPPPGKALADMTREELEAELAALAAE